MMNVWFPEKAPLRFRDRALTRIMAGDGWIAERLHFHLSRWSGNITTRCEDSWDRDGLGDGGFAPFRYLLVWLRLALT